MGFSEGIFEQTIGSLGCLKMRSDLECSNLAFNKHKRCKNTVMILFSKCSITQKMADRGRSDLYIAFTMILCGANFLLGKLCLSQFQLGTSPPPPPPSNPWEIFLSERIPVTRAIFLFNSLPRGKK